MMRDIARLLADASILALRCAWEEWPRRGFRALPLPAGWMGVVERGDGRRALLDIAAPPGGDAGDALFLARTGPLRVAVLERQADSADGHPCSGTIELVVRFGDGVDELVSARRRLLVGDAPLRGDELTRTFTEAGLRDASRAFIRAQPAERLVSGALEIEWTAHVRERLKRFLFDAGLVLERAVATVTSDTLLRERAARRDTEQRLDLIKTRDTLEQAALAATRRRLDDLSAILGKLRGGASSERVSDAACEFGSDAGAEAAGRPPESGPGAQTAGFEREAGGRQSESTPAAAPHARSGFGLDGAPSSVPGAAPGAVRSAAPSAVRWADALAALSPAERGQLLENLWRITPDKKIARAIVVVAGGECLWLDPKRPDSITQRAAVPPDLGGLRSVGYDADEDCLLIGAASGVWVLTAREGERIGCYRAPAADRPRTGFNAAVVANRRLFATHSQLGCWSWAVGDPADARQLLAPTETGPRVIRAVLRFRDGIALAADASLRFFDSAGGATGAADLPPACRAGGAGDSRLSITDEGARLVSNAAGASIMATRVSVSPGASGSSAAAIHSLCVIERTIFAGTSHGCVLEYAAPASFEAAADESAWRLVHRGVGSVESIHARRWSDLLEIVVPAGAQGVLGIYPDQGVTTPLLGAPTSLRRVWVSDDAIVALSDARDRLFVMNADMPQRAGRDVPIGRMTGRSVQDVCIVA